MRADSILMVAAMALVIIPAVLADALLGGWSATFVTTQPQQYHLHAAAGLPVVQLRGGATTAVGDNEELEIESSDEELEEESDDEEEEKKESDSKLVKAAQAKAASIKREMAKAAVKAAVAATVSAPKKKKSSRSSLFRIPYIIKASMNPFTFTKMTRSYFASLFKLDFLQDSEDSSQNLRSALEQKAKRGGSNRGKRKFKPGQAKTLADLPVLNT